MPHKCEKCYKCFDRRSQLETHLGKTPPCVVLDLKIPNSSDCIFCGNAFISKSSVNRHVKICPVLRNNNALIDCIKRKHKMMIKMLIQNHQDMIDYKEMLRNEFKIDYAKRTSKFEQLCRKKYLENNDTETFYREKYNRKLKMLKQKVINAIDE